MFGRAMRANRGIIAASTAAWIATPSSANYYSAETTTPLRYHYTCCEGNKNSNDARIRKRATVKMANHLVVQRKDTRGELGKLRSIQQDMLKRWEKDEDGWRELPARAWPEYQPNPEQLKGIQLEVKHNGCDSNKTNSTDICQTLLFHAATALVFYSVDPIAGLEQYEVLAQQGHVDSMVACGVILVEGLIGLKNHHREKEGVQWLQKAVDQESTQACYELGTVFYTGLDDVVDEDVDAAFCLFQKAAEQGHVGALYMMADCLIEGEGTEVDVARALPLLYQAADRGHRYARQRVRELLGDKKYQS